MSFPLACFLSNEPVHLVITYVGQQGLTTLLPLAWSPVEGADVSPPDAALGGKSAALKVRNRYSLSPGSVVDLVRWNLAEKYWVAQVTGVVSSSGEYLEANVDDSGKFMFVIPDACRLPGPDSWRTAFVRVCNRG